MRFSPGLAVLFLLCGCAGSAPQTRSPSPAPAAPAAAPTAAAAPGAPARAQAPAASDEDPPDEPVARVAWFEALVARTPGDVRAWRGLTSALRGANRLQEAARAAWTAVELAPEAWEGWYNVANVLMQAQAFPEALKAQAEVQRLGAPPERAAKGLLDVGYRAWGLGDDALALELYARAAALAPALPVVEFDRAMLYAQRGDKALAEAAVKRGLALLESTPTGTPQQSASVAEFRAAFERLRTGERPPRPGLLGPAQPLPARFLTRPTAPARELPLDARSVRLYPAPLGGVLRLQVPTTWSERVRIEQDITAVQVVANAEADPESFFISAHPLPPGLTPAELVQKSRAELQREGAQVADAESFRSDALQGSVIWAARPPGGGEGRYVGQVFATAGERLVTGTRLAPADAPADRAAFLEAMRSLSFQATVPR